MIYFLPRCSEAAILSLTLLGKKSRSLCWKQKVQNMLYFVLVTTDQGCMTILIAIVLTMTCIFEGQLYAQLVFR